MKNKLAIETKVVAVAYSWPVTYKSYSSQSLSHGSQHFRHIFKSHTLKLFQAKKSVSPNGTIAGCNLELESGHDKEL